MSRHGKPTLHDLTVGLVVAGTITAMAARGVDAMDIPRAGLGAASMVTREFPAVTDTSYSVRTFRASATVCSIVERDSGTRLGIQHVRGTFSGGLSASDSALVYVASADEWRVARLAGLWTGNAAWAAAPLGGGTPSCSSDDSDSTESRPEATLELDASPSFLDRIDVGAPVRAFRSTEFGVFQQEGDWWLGERASEASGWQILTGPLFPPVPGGIEFSQYKADGTPAIDGFDVATLEVLLWTRGDPRYPAPSSEKRRGKDHMRIRVHLRNGGAG
jgi:hypothetical protein